MQRMNTADPSGAKDRRSPRSAEKQPMMHSVIFACICTLLSLSLPVIISFPSVSPYLSWFVILAAGALLVYASKSFFSIIILTLACSFMLYYSGTPTAAALIAGITAILGIYSALTARTGAAATACAVSAPVLSCAGVYALTGDLILMSAAAVAYLPALAMGLSMRLKKSRKAAIISFASICTAMLALVSLLHIYKENGTVTAEILTNAADFLHRETSNLLAWTVRDLGGISQSEIPINAINTVAEQTVNLIPGLAIAAFMTVGFFIQKLQHALIMDSDGEDVQNRSGEPIQASLLSAVIFIISHVCSYTSSASNGASLFGTAAMNISLIFMPLMLCIGCEFIFSLPKKIGFLAILVWIGAVILSAMLSSSVISILSLAGSFRTVTVRIDQWAQEHYSKGEDQ